MLHLLVKWFRVAYKNTITSIAFLPAIIALCFLLFSFFMIQFDFSEAGKTIKANLHWLSLKDASTARSICSAITSGLISLTVFSFSMVMILLNQAASQMSNRVLDKLIGNRFQQFVLGFYIGTIVDAMFLLSTIRDIDSGIYVPAISTYLLITLTIIDIFLFIYFLHYITQSVKYETIISKIFETTKDALSKSCFLKQMPEVSGNEAGNGRKVTAHKSGVYQGFEMENLLNFCKREDVIITFLYPVGTFLLDLQPLLTVSSKKVLSKDFEKKLSMFINIHRGQEINTSYYYGFKQLMEVGVRALSPGINDPGTAIISLRAIGELLALRLRRFPQTHFIDKDDALRIIGRERTFEEIFIDAVLPVWDYGKNDRLIQQEMHHILTQLKRYSDSEIIEQMLQSVNKAIFQNR